MLTTANKMIKGLKRLKRLTISTSDLITQRQAAAILEQVDRTEQNPCYDKVSGIHKNPGFAAIGQAQVPTTNRRPDRLRSKWWTGFCSSSSSSRGINKSSSPCIARSTHLPLSDA